MSLDFSFSAYVNLMTALKECNYRIIPVKQYGYVSDEKVLILRHDVDRIPENAIKMAVIEAELGIRGSYYFRIKQAEKYCKFIQKISELGHEIGYHYEEVNTVLKQNMKYPYSIIFNKKMSQKEEEQMLKEAYRLFKKNVDRLRKTAEICTITMHGSPISRYDNRVLWQKYSYKKLGIIIEPYYDVDWDNYTYLTDTGRKWNADGCNIRDKVISKRILNYRTSSDIIKNADALPNKLLITVHPERWSDNLYSWIKQLFMQNIKNAIKVIIFKNFYFVHKPKWRIQ